LAFSGNYKLKIRDLHFIRNLWFNLVFRKLQTNNNSAGNSFPPYLERPKILYEHFMDYLPPFYTRNHSIRMLTICLPKLTLAI